MYAGAAETAARLQPLDATEVRPGGDALVRLHLERPLVLDVFEPLVLRDSGRDETVGGGLVLDPFPPAAVRGTAARVRRTEELEAREAAGRAGLLERVLAERGVVPLADLPPASPPSPRTASRPPSPPPGCRRRHLPDPGLDPGRPGRRPAAAVLEAVERTAPGRPVRPRSPGPGGPGGRRPGALARPGWPASAGAEVVEALVADGRLVADGPTLRLPGHGPRLDPAQRALRARVEAALDEAGVGLLGDAALAELGADRKATALLVRLGVLVAGRPRWLPRPLDPGGGGGDPAPQLPRRPPVRRHRGQGGPRHHPPHRHPPARAPRPHRRHRPPGRPPPPGLDARNGSGMAEWWPDAPPYRA